MTDLFNLVFNDCFDLERYQFNRPYKESEKYRLYQKEGKGYILSVDARGVAEKDIKIDFRPASKEKDLPYISIKGSSTVEDSGETYSMNISGYLTIAEPIEKINYKCQDGVCIIFIKTKQKAKEPSIEIKATDKLSW